jgi:hypothetical protein
MQFKKIVGFGDSWMYGDELLDPALAAEFPDAHPCWFQNNSYREENCFLGLLGKHYNLPVENFGIPGGSLQSTMWTYMWWLEQEPAPQDCIVLIFLTEPDRHTFYNPTPYLNSNSKPWDHYIHTTWIEYGASVIPDDFQTLGKQYMVLTHCKEQSKLNYLQAALFFDGQQARIGMPLLQFHTTKPESSMKISTIPWPDRNWIRYFRDHPENQKRELIFPGGHPNEIGHAHIRDLLIPEVDRVII